MYERDTCIEFETAVYREAELAGTPKAMDSTSMRESLEIPSKTEVYLPVILKSLENLQGQLQIREDHLAENNLKLLATLERTRSQVLAKLSAQYGLLRSQLDLTEISYAKLISHIDGGDRAKEILAQLQEMHQTIQTSNARHPTSSSIEGSDDLSHETSTPALETEVMANIKSVSKLVSEISPVSDILKAIKTLKSHTEVAIATKEFATAAVTSLKQELAELRSDLQVSLSNKRPG